MDKLLAMEGITKSFYGVSVLKGVNFDLERGEVHVLLGENGAGKSTLMKILSGAYTLDGGTVTLDGETLDLGAHSPRRAEDLGIVTIYQNFHLIPHLSVAENLSLRAFTRERGLIRWKEVYAYAAETLGRIDFAIDLRTKVRDLPVSQKQMLEIAIALSKNAKVIVMDEPTAALSRKEIETLFATIADVKARGIGIIYISHKLEEVKTVGDRITVLRDGMNVATLDARSADLKQVISLMIGKEEARRGEARSAPPGDELLRVEGLTSHRLPAPASLAVRAGEILGVTGLVGAGKTELARAIFGVDRARSGSAVLAGKAVYLDAPRRAIRRGIGYLPEDRDADGLCLNMGVRENISLVLLTKLRGLFFNQAQEKRTVTRVVDSIGVKSAGLAQQVKYLSGGNKQKVVFGKWLTGGCNVLLLDEPTIGIDVGARGEIYQLIREFVAEPGRAVIFISSDLDEVLEVTDRIVVMSGGRLVAELDPKHTTKQEIMQHAMQAM
jgi:ribose transport system ATP-binding protein